MSTELRPCPFCGCQAQIDAARVLCRNPYCWGPVVDHYEYLSDAIAAWNTRANDTTITSQAAEIERLREALKPFANYMDDGMDCNYIGEPLPDADGVGWVYLTHGDFRRARAALNWEKP